MLSFGPVFPLGDVRMNRKKACDWRDSFPRTTSGRAVLTIYALFIRFVQRRMSRHLFSGSLSCTRPSKFRTYYTQYERPVRRKPRR
jgi:hypothetical protein